MYKKILFVEDGSVDMDVISQLQDGRPEIFVIVYRQGSTPPILHEIDIKK